VELRRQFSRRSGTVRSLKSVHDLLHVFHLWRRGEAMADELSPFLEVRRAAETDIVIVNGIPGNEQPVAALLFDRAPQLHSVTALARLKIGAAFFTPASNSDSMPGLTSICAISVIMTCSGETTANPITTAGAQNHRHLCSPRDLRISAPEGHDVSAGSAQSSGIAAMAGMRRPGI
jgi:hypothetical protein